MSAVRCVDESRMRPTIEHGQQLLRRLVRPVAVALESGNDYHELVKTFLIQIMSLLYVRVPAY